MKSKTETQQTHRTRRRFTYWTYSNVLVPATAYLLQWMTTEIIYQHDTSTCCCKSAKKSSETYCTMISEKNVEISTVSLYALYPVKPKFFSLFHSLQMRRYHFYCKSKSVSWKGHQLSPHWANIVLPLNLGKTFMSYFNAYQICMWIVQSSETMNLLHQLPPLPALLLFQQVHTG